jgi:hypothetical protein
MKPIVQWIGLVGKFLIASHNWLPLCFPLVSFICPIIQFWVLLDDTGHSWFVCVSCQLLLCSLSWNWAQDAMVVFHTQSTTRYEGASENGLYVHGITWLCPNFVFFMGKWGEILDLGVPYFKTCWDKRIGPCLYCSILFRLFKIIVPKKLWYGTSRYVRYLAPTNLDLLRDFPWRKQGTSSTREISFLCITLWEFNEIYWYNGF